MPTGGISPEVAVTVLDFITYGMYAAGAMAVYFGFRFLFYESEGDSGEDTSGREATRTKAVDWIKNKAAVSKRKHLLEPAKGFLIRAMQHCDKGREEFEVQSATALRRGRDHAEQVHHNLNSARRVMRTAWHHARGEQREDLQHLTAAVEGLRNRVHSDVIGHIPRNHTDSSWHATISQIRRDLQEIEREIAALIQAIDQFIDADSRTVPSVTGARGGSGGAGPSGAGGVPGRGAGPSGGSSGVPLRGSGTRGRVGSP